MLKEKILPKLVLLNTRLVVGSYTALTLPFYTILQRPWLRFRQSKVRRTQMERSADGSYFFWKRYGPPIALPNNYHTYNSFQEIFEVMKKTEDMDKPRLSYREVFSEKIKYDEKGEPIKQDGKIVKEIKLSPEYKWLSGRQVFERLSNLRRGFATLGIAPRDKVIIYADTRIEWFLSALSLLLHRSILVTLFSNLGKKGLAHGMQQTEAKYLITSIDLLDRVSCLIDQAPNIEKIFYMRYDFQKNQALPKFPDRVQLIPWDEVEEYGKSKPEVEVTKSDPNDVAVIMYTSGTTGIPKAVIFTGKQLKAALMSLASNVVDLADDAPKHCYASFLPLAHILGFTFELFLFTGGVKIGYSSPNTLTDASPAHGPGQLGDLKLLKPTTLVTVPLILDRIVKEIYLKLSARSPILPPLFTYLMDYKIRWTNRGFDTPILNRIVCRRVQEQFGGNLEFIVSGGAPLNPRTQELVSAALNVKLMQGYGLTETTGGVLGMRRDDIGVGMVGYPLEGNMIRLVSWPEGGYTTEDKPNPRGEILASGDSVAQGYYMLEDETKAAFVTESDGTRWFYSGDIGEVLPNGAVKIIDRKKDLAKLPNGEYISLGKIESVIKTVPHVENVCIALSSTLNDIVALVTPSGKQLHQLALELGKNQLSRAELCADSEVNQYIHRAIEDMCQRNGLHRREIPARVHLCAEEWLPDNDLLTAAFKLKRANVLKYYRVEVDKLFQRVQAK